MKQSSDAYALEVHISAIYMICLYEVIKRCLCFGSAYQRSIYDLFYEAIKQCLCFGSA